MKKSILSALAIVALTLSVNAARADSLNINAQTGTTYTIASTDCSKLVTLTNAASVAVSLPQASSASGGGAGSGNFLPPCTIEVLNTGAGTVTITPTTSTIGGAASAILTNGQGMTIVSDGVNYQAQAGGFGLGSGASSWAASGTASTPAFGAAQDVPNGAGSTVKEWLEVTTSFGVKVSIPGF